MVGQIKVTVPPNTNLTSIQVNVTFNRDSLAQCFVTQKGASKPKLEAGGVLNELLGQYAYANEPLEFEMFTGRPGRRVVKKGCYGNGYLARPEGCTKAYCMTPIMYCVDPTVDQRRAEIAEFPLKYDREYWMWCAAASYASSGNIDGVADDAIVVGPTKFRTPKDPFRCIRRTPSSEGFKVQLLRGDEKIYGEKNFDNNGKLLETTKFYNKQTDFPTVLLVNSNEENNYQGPKSMDSLKCFADSDHDAEKIGWKLDHVVWDDKPVREDQKEDGWDPESDEKDDEAGENRSKYYMVEDDFNATDRRLRRTLLAEDMDPTVGWGFDTDARLGPGSFALGIPNHVKPGFYRVRIRAIHTHLKNNVGQFNANVHELLVCVCSNLECGRQSITTYKQQGKGICGRAIIKTILYPSTGDEKDYQCDTCVVGGNANCASCDPNRAAEGADDADNSVLLATTDIL